ncbi:hypothetical protein BHM03_00023830 [Ensete ventricosum]|nr:hypothetical protein BHM03_00023830 [Ensete ventricosum]
MQPRPSSGGSNHSPRWRIFFYLRRSTVVDTHICTQPLHFPINHRSRTAATILPSLLRCEMTTHPSL